LSIHYAIENQHAESKAWARPEGINTARFRAKTPTNTSLKHQKKATKEQTKKTNRNQPANSQKSNRKSTENQLARSQNSSEQYFVLPSWLLVSSRT